MLCAVFQYGARYAARTGADFDDCSAVKRLGIALFGTAYDFIQQVCIQNKVLPQCFFADKP